MKILTLNTWQERGPWEKRWELIFEGLQALQPELVGFQETFNGAWMKEVQDRSGYPYLVFEKNECGLSILSRYPVEERGCQELETASPTEEYKRYLLWAALRVEGELLWFFNTHLSWKLDEGNIREKQVGEILDIMDTQSSFAEAAVVGDFNAEPSSPEVRKMIFQGKFHDTYAVLHPKSAAVTWDNENDYVQQASVVLPDRRIDYVFVRNQGAVLGRLQSVEIVLAKPGKDGIRASDHYGVLARF
ncbi:endonuclease/exonuclease/phosphatase family protein [Omnitrophica bacterium]|nr:endonuclease/exonuclease/phosphatase family protein [Candidatus Omnitrophota bacterium]